MKTRIEINVVMNVINVKKLLRIMRNTIVGVQIVLVVKNVLFIEVIFVV
jgi:hypothetical protein